jgi:hypothetical protein
MPAAGFEILGGPKGNFYPTFILLLTNIRSQRL